MTVRAGDLQYHLQQAIGDLAQIEARHREAAQLLGGRERELTEVTTQIDKIRAEIEQRRTAHLDALRQGAQLGQRISALESKVAATEAAAAQHENRLELMRGSRQTLIAEIQPLRAAVDELSAQAARCQGSAKAIETELDQRRRELAEANQALTDVQRQADAVTQRIHLLEELEKRLEGVSAGAKELIARSKQPTPGVYAGIRGLVADLLQVSVENAAVVEVALGELANYLVVAPSEPVLEALQQERGMPSRVGILRLDAMLPPAAGLQVDLQNKPGVVARADSLVETSSEFAILSRRLLASTWVVETMADALRLQQQVAGAVSFVTRAGEMVDSTGGVVVGPRQSSTGLISRRSELRTLRSQADALYTKQAEQERECGRLADETAQLDRKLRLSLDQLQEMQSGLAEHRLELGTAEERLNLLEKQLATVEADLKAAQMQHDAANEHLALVRVELTKLESSVTEIEARNQQAVLKSQELELHRQRQLRETEAVKVELARIEQQLDNLRTRKDQLERDQLERGRALSESRGHFAATQQRLRQSQQAILQAESEIAELYLRKETLAKETVRLLEDREQHRFERGQLAQEAQRIRQRIRKVEGRLHAKDLAVGEVRHERQTLADRLREDYGIKLETLEHQPTQEELLEREGVDREIADLRAKINSIGSVNLDALAELEELEGRFDSLSSQFQDLTSAKNSLEQIINRINADSRRLFVETLETVREHFQSLFRKLFGGGQADIVLDEGVDVLDSGIEVIARPPGKEPRNISLLSGGEKTLTCVAMLLAIFRSRPSPFCVLDEVDAALDEANIERFIGVVKEFMAWTQFIIVTHSKKTMTCADTLYGITMQESGVSKRVSVRFEDVSEDGQITRIRDDAGGDETAAA
jgi:chromosome segregation protein